MTINWNEFTTGDFWFGIDRVSVHLADKIILYAGVAAVILGLVLLISRFGIKNQFLKRVAGQLSSLFIVIGIAEVAWYGMRIQFIGALGTHFTAALIALIGLVWLYFPVSYLLRRYGKDMAEAQRQMMKEKYLNR